MLSLMEQFESEQFEQRWNNLTQGLRLPHPEYPVSTAGYPPITIRGDSIYRALPYLHATPAHDIDDSGLCAYSCVSGPLGRLG